MHVIDLHCDVLYKIQNAKRAGETLSFRDSEILDVNLEKMKKGKIKAQAFAIFLSPDIPSNEQFDYALEQIEIFHKEVIEPFTEMVHLKSWLDFSTLKEDEIGAFLTFEGLDAIGNQMDKLDYLLDEGILSVGLTWNGGNLVADGVGEQRGAGLSQFGFEVVKKLNKRKILTDVSHLSVAGFWDVMDVADYPIASHSNVYQIADHRRNLSNPQIKKMVERQVPIHLVFSPGFTNTTSRDGKATIADLLTHIEYLIDLGAENIIGLGSDFDGIVNHIEALTNASEMPNLLAAIETKYTKELAEKIGSANFMQYISTIK